jgi:excisionase family DNA binding protein
MRKGFVYVISFAGYYKIGRAAKPPERLKQILSVKFPISPILELAIEVPDAPYAERALHLMYASSRVVGEWFDLRDVGLPAIANAIGSLDYSRLGALANKNGLGPWGMEFCTIVQAAQMLKISRPTVYKLIGDGLLKRYVVIGRKALKVADVKKLARQMSRNGRKKG